MDAEHFATAVDGLMMPNWSHASDAEVRACVRALQDRYRLHRNWPTRPFPVEQAVLLRGARALAKFKLFAALAPGAVFAPEPRLLATGTFREDPLCAAFDLVLTVDAERACLVLTHDGFERGPYLLGDVTAADATDE